MRIGIDIDDTITNTWEYMIPIYASVFNKSELELKKSLPYYNAIKDTGISVDKYFEIMGPYYEKNIDKVPLKEGVIEVIKRLHEMGHIIIFITARGRMYDNEYQVTKDYLDKHHIYYDKLIVRATEKDKICLNETIDLFIDDSAKHCEAVSKTGIKVLMFENRYNKDNQKFSHIKEWSEIDNYLKDSN